MRHYLILVILICSVACCVHGQDWSWDKPEYVYFLEKRGLFERKVRALYHEMGEKKLEKLMQDMTFLEQHFTKKSLYLIGKKDAHYLIDSNAREWALTLQKNNLEIPFEFVSDIEYLRSFGKTLAQNIQFLKAFQSVLSKEAFQNFAKTSCFASMKDYRFLENLQKIGFKNLSAKEIHEISHAFREADLNYNFLKKHYPKAYPFSVFLEKMKKLNIPLSCWGFEGLQNLYRDIIEEHEDEIFKRLQFLKERNVNWKDLNKLVRFATDKRHQETPFIHTHHRRFMVGLFLLEPALFHIIKTHKLNDQGSYSEESLFIGRHLFLSKKAVTKESIKTCFDEIQKAKEGIKTTKPFEKGRRIVIVAHNQKNSQTQGNYFGNDNLIKKITQLTGKNPLVFRAPKTTSKTTLKKMKDEIAKAIEETKTPTTFIFIGHGSRDAFWFVHGEDPMGKGSPQNAECFHFQNFIDSYRKQKILGHCVFFLQCMNNNMYRNCQKAFREKDFIVCPSEFGQVTWAEESETYSFPFLKYFLSNKPLKEILKQQMQNNSDLNFFAGRIQIR